MEGYPARAHYEGKSYGFNFADACERHYRQKYSYEDFVKYFRRWYSWYWVRLFDNEVDARKSFG